MISNLSTGIHVLTGIAGKTWSLFFLFSMTVFLVEAQPCRCDHTIASSMLAVNGATQGVQPGDTVCLEQGTKAYLYLTDFIGDSLHYIVFINCGGPVTVQNATMYGIKFMNSRYFRITGTGVDTIRYGIRVLGTGSGSSGLTLDGKSTNFEVDHLEVANTGFAGIMSKTDPKCDLSANRGNFTQYQTVFHDNYIHNTGGEGFYIGHSFYNGYPTTCSGLPDTLYPHDLRGVRVYNNIVTGPHWDGIQVGCAIEDCEIFGNTITGYGSDAVAGQIAGIQVGGGTTGKCYNNLISGGTGTGITVFGTGNNLIFNNVIKDLGWNYFPEDPTKRVHGIFCDDRATVPGRSFNFINNTIVNVKTDGIRFYSLQSANNLFLNNIIIHPGSLGSYSTSAQSYIYLSSGVSASVSNNYTEATMASVHFRDTISGNFRLMDDSPAREYGTDLSALGITFDCDTLFRPWAASFDAGAYEYHPENRWTGQVSSSWNNAGNWSKAGVPLEGDDVIIPQGAAFPIILSASGQVCHHLVIGSGAEFTIAPAAEITVAGNLTIEQGGAIDNQGSVIIKGHLINQNP